MNEGTIFQVGARTTAPHFYRCLECCEVFTVETKLDANKPVVCACEGQRLEYLGQSKVDRLVREVDRVPCDARCTYANGPDCTCVCGGCNHGTARLVRVVLDAGDIPRVTLKDAEAAKTRRKELTDETQAAHDRIAAKYGADYVKRFDMRLYIASKETWTGIRDGREEIGHARTLKTHKNRIASLRKVCSQ